MRFTNASSPRLISLRVELFFLFGCDCCPVHIFHAVLFSVHTVMFDSTPAFTTCMRDGFYERSPRIHTVSVDRTAGARALTRVVVVGCCIEGNKVFCTLFNFGESFLPTYCLKPNHDVGCQAGNSFDPDRLTVLPVFPDQFSVQVNSPNISGWLCLTNGFVTCPVAFWRVAFLPAPRHQADCVFG